MFLAFKCCVNITLSKYGVWTFVDNIITNLICEFLWPKHFLHVVLQHYKNTNKRNGIIEIVTQENNNSP
jgi:uncharacterized membrane protein YpjA